MSIQTSILDITRLKQHQLKNRTVVAPMTRVSTKGDGIPTEAMGDYYQRYAQGGFAVIIAEGTYTDQAFSQAYPNQPGITNERQQQGWQPIVQSVHKDGAKIILQLMHAGALSQHLSNTRSASAIQPLRKMLPGYSERQGLFPMPQAMSTREIEQVIEGFTRSAIRAEQAGFDGIEVHAANGYLLDQFITDYSNKRQDQYGGNIINRCRLTTEIVQSIKSAVSADFILGVRVSQGKVNDFDYKWPNGTEDGKAIFAALEKAGADYIHFASEGKGFNHGCLTPDEKSLPQLARQVTNLPVIANGGLEQISEAERIISQGHADLLALGTGALANPDWPNRIQSGEAIQAFTPAMFDQGVTVEAQLQWEQTQSLSPI